MAYIWNTNNISGSNINGLLLYALKESLLSGGWLLKGNGNGVDSYDNIATNNSSQATDYLTTAADMSNPRSWFRVRTPGRLPDGNYRELTIQLTRYSSAATYYPLRVKYSRCVSDSGFYGASGTGTGSYDITPRTSTISDEYIIAGSAVGSDTGSYDIFGNGTLTGEGLPYGGDFDSSNNYWSTAVDNASPYPFYLLAHTKTTKAAKCTFSFFPMIDGTYNSADLDPYVFYFGFSKIRGILGLGTANENMVDLTANHAPTAGQYSISSNDVLLPTEFYRLASATVPRGWKGASNFTLSSTAKFSRQNLDTYNVNSTRDKIINYINFGYGSYFFAIFPWDGSVPQF